MGNRTIFIISVFILFCACESQPDKVHQLQGRADSLQARLDSTYKPGLGEFMLGIQLHHAKLWFAGTNENWKLADFEVHEIGETLDDIKQYCKDRPEVKNLGTIDPAISSITSAIKQKDIQLFKKGFVGLTKGCNTCHKNTGHEFNVITIPSALPVTNQDFKPVK